MNRWAIEMSTAHGSLAMETDGKFAHATFFEAGHRQSAPFYRALQDALREWPRPEELLIGLGPGQHSNLRVAMATAFGLAAGFKIPIQGLTSLIAFEGPKSESSYHIAGNARRSEWFHARVEQRQLVQGPEIVGQEAFLKWRETHPGLWLTPDLTSDELQPARPTAKLLLEAARAHPSQVRQSPDEPHYLRPPLVSQPTRNRFPGLTDA